MGKIAKDLFLSLVESEGFCCPHSYLTQLSSVPTGALAKRLGLDRRTVQKWRAALRDGKVKGCRLCPPGGGDPQDQDTTVVPSP